MLEQGEQMSLRNMWYSLLKPSPLEACLCLLVMWRCTITVFKENEPPNTILCYNNTSHLPILGSWSKQWWRQRCKRVSRVKRGLWGRASTEETGSVCILVDRSGVYIHMYVWIVPIVEATKRCPFNKNPHPPLPCSFFIKKEKKSPPSVRILLLLLSQPCGYHDNSSTAPFIC